MQEKGCSTHVEKGCSTQKKGCSTQKKWADTKFYTSISSGYNAKKTIDGHISLEQNNQMLSHVDFLPDGVKVTL
ncbi:MAG: hypothetical protein JJU41_10865 [Bacteroidetes bacterium]|nr:hypothetical protein [Bacteroidota bacterium]MCH8523901.1 hypothetical protein [Balneolales bacterium]